MTIKDKIEQLENLKCHCSDMGKAECSSNEWMKDIEALDFAIATVKQEACKECVSKQAVDMLVDELARAISDKRWDITRGRSTASIMQDILDLPPATPTFPKGTTNGDVIKAMFPNATKSNYIDISNKSTLYIDDEHELEVDVDWWNAPYESGE